MLESALCTTVHETRLPCLAAYCEVEPEFGAGARRQKLEPVTKSPHPEQ